MKLQPVHFKDLGLSAYATTWALQEQLMAKNLEEKSLASHQALPHEVNTTHHLLFCEHPHVYTLGKNGKTEHLLISPAERERLGIEFFPINRGGDITYHGPGQLVGYPIFDLEKLKPDLGWYLRSLEEVFIQTLAAYGLRGERLPGATGVWLGAHTPNPRKICALGVRCSRWVTMHGFAFNIHTDLGFFNFIVPCGIPDKGVTSLEVELGWSPDAHEVKRRVLDSFAEVFGVAWITA